MINTRPTVSRPATRVLAGIVAAVAVLIMAAPTAVADTPRITQTSDVLAQGGNGLYQGDGARLVRSDGSLRIKWQVPTPEPGTYQYPTADQVPPGAPTHPEIIAGWPEVFTLWVFVFNHPELCTVPCDFDDIGDTPAQGGVHQADGIIAHGNKITLRGDVEVGAPSLAGATLTSPLTAEVHVAMTSHGQAYSGDELARQMTIAVGTPAEWWPAIFPAPSP